MVTDTARQMPSPTGEVVPIGHARGLRTTEATGEHRHDNPHWPVRSPADAANALILHSECPWHCSTRLAALLVSRDDYQYFRDRIGGVRGWTPQ